ncbi:hypothetical protein [Streptomyces canus]|uniref:hypothetical protein n=1 Tax=Streptomyces canus TaxID=58343 RepID=UPI002E25B6CC
MAIEFFTHLATIEVGVSFYVIRPERHRPDEQHDAPLPRPVPRYVIYRPGIVGHLRTAGCRPGGAD